MFNFVNLLNKLISVSGDVGGTDRIFQPHTSEAVQGIVVNVPASKKSR